MTVPVLLDSAGRRRSPATMPGYHAGRPPRQGHAVPRRPADGRGDRRRHAPHGRGSTWVAASRDDRRALARRSAHSRSPRAGRIRPRPAPRVAARPQRQGRQAPRSRDGRVGLGAPAPMAHCTARAAHRAAVLHHRRATRGRPWSSAAVRSQLRRLTARAGVRRRFAPHQLRHAHALELAREGVTLNIIQRQLGHAKLGTTSIYLQGTTPRRSSPPCAHAGRR
jgi:integrase